MAQVIPFGAMHFNAEKNPDITEMVCPPYDMIDEDFRKTLLERSPYNYVQLILPEGDEEERYRNSMHRIFSWLLRDVLVIDKEPCYYLYEQDFTFEGEEFKRVGFFGLEKIEEYGQNVKRHERTFPKYVEDRYNLLSETQSHLEGIFLLYQDEQKELQKELEAFSAIETPLYVVKDEDGNTHKIFPIADQALNEKIRNFMSTRPVYIADGHHRYETSLRYMKAMKDELGDKYKGNEPFNFLLAAFFNAYDEGVKVFPTHRVLREVKLSGADVLKKLEMHYKIAAMEFTDYRLEKAARMKMRTLLNQYKAQGKHAFGVYLKDYPNKYFIITLKDEAGSIVNRPVSAELKALDVLILEESILTPIFNIDTHSAEKPLMYVRGDSKALDLVKTDKYDIAFILNPVSPVQVVKVADNNEEMPHKSTDFYPKLLSGLTAYSLKYSKIKP